MALNYTVNVGFKVDATALKNLQSQFGSVTTATKAQTAATQQATQANNAYTMSAKAQAAAMRGVPAQITDIFVSLQGGQKPLTVLLQQGGQLKDMFGGIVPAAKALAESLLGFINPLTLGAVALGAIGYALYDGHEKMEAFRKSLILTGSASGTTADQLQSLANSVAAGSKSLTSGDTSDALAQIVSTGKIVGDQLGLVTKASAQMKALTGADIKDTVDQFVELQKDPITAIAKLNDSQHFLTTTTYENIKSLVDQGKNIEASKAAFKAYADAIDSRAKQSAANIGLFASAWQSVKKAFSDADVKINELAGAGDATKKLDDLAFATQGAENALKELQARKAKGGPSGFFVTDKDISNAQAGVDRAKALEAAQYALVKAANDKAKADQNSATVAQYVSDADAKDTSQYISNADKRKKLIDQERSLAAQALAAAGDNQKDRDLINTALAKNIADINDKYKDAKQPLSEYDRLLKQFNQTITSFQNTNSKLDSQNNIGDLLQKWAGDPATSKLSSELKAITDNISKMGAEVTDATVDAEGNLQVQYKMNDAYAERFSAVLKDTDNQAKWNATIAQGVTNGKAYGDTLDSIAKAQKQAQFDSANSAKFNTQVGSLTQANNAIGSGQFDSSLNSVKAYQDYLKREQTIQGEIANAKEKGLSYDEQTARAQYDQVASLQKVNEEYLDQLKQLDDIKKGVADGITSMIESAITTGKINFKSFLADLANMLIKSAVLKYAQQLFGAFGSYSGGGGASGGGAMYSLGGSTSSYASLAGYKDGGAFSAGKQFFAAGDVVNRATSFGMANGKTGVMGEAGPEAILPLSRKGGKLGVNVTGATSGAGNVNNNFSPTVQISMQSGSDEDAKKTAAVLQRTMKDMFLKWTQDQMRSGNLLNPGFKNRYY